MQCLLPNCTVLKMTTSLYSVLTSGHCCTRVYQFMPDGSHKHRLGWPLLLMLAHSLCKLTQARQYLPECLGNCICFLFAKNQGELCTLQQREPFLASALHMLKYQDLLSSQTEMRLKLLLAWCTFTKMMFPIIDDWPQIEKSLKVSCLLLHGQQTF